MVFAVLLFALGLFFFINALRMPTENLGSFGGNSAATAPGLLPAIVSGVIMLLSIVLFVSAYKENARITKADLKKAWEVLISKTSQRVVLVVLIVVIYGFVLLGNVHYLAATFIYLFAFMWIFKAGKIWKILLISIATSICIWLFFGQVAMIPLP